MSLGGDGWKTDNGNAAVTDEYDHLEMSALGNGSQNMPQIRPGGLEPPTLGSEVRCSIQLSYGRVDVTLIVLSEHVNINYEEKSLGRVTTSSGRGNPGPEDAV